MKIDSGDMFLIAFATAIGSFIGHQLSQDILFKWVTGFVFGYLSCLIMINVLRYLEFKNSGLYRFKEIKR